MLALLSFALVILAARFKSKSRLEAENAVLRHQSIVLRRKLPGRALCVPETSSGNDFGIARQNSLFLRQNSLVPVVNQIRTY
jgi:hypothetical protein